MYYDVEQLADWVDKDRNAYFTCSGRWWPTYEPPWGLVHSRLTGALNEHPQWDYPRDLVRTGCVSRLSML
jgi:hypothetical protein